MKRHVHPQAVTRDFQAAPPMPAWTVNWISYRASLRTVDRREEVDATDIAVVCVSCGCEVDITPQPHSPKCPISGATV